MSPVSNYRGYSYYGHSGFSGEAVSGVDYTGKHGKSYRRLHDGSVLIYDGGIWYDENKNIIPEEEARKILQQESEYAIRRQHQALSNEIAIINAVQGIYPYGGPREETPEEKEQRRALECKMKKEASQKRWSRRLRWLAFVFLLGCLLFGFLVRLTP